MLRSAVENLPIESILIHRLSVVEKIQKQTNSFCEIANTSQRDLPTLQVGCVGEKFYLLSNFDVFYGIQESRLDNAECNVHDFDNETELLIKHVRLNKNPIGFNPLSLFPLIKFLESNGINTDQISGLLQIHDTINEKIINQNLSTDAINGLSELYTILAMNLPQPIIPFYAIKLIAKCDLSQQKNAVETLSTLVIGAGINASRFYFPSPEEIQIQLNDSSFYQSSHESVIVKPKGSGKTTIQNMKQAEYLRKIEKDSIIIPATETTPAIIFNKKTNSASIVNEENTIIKYTSIDKKPVYALSEKLTKDFTPEQLEKLQEFSFKSQNHLAHFIEKHPDIKGVVLYQNEI